MNLIRISSICKIKFLKAFKFKQIELFLFSEDHKRDIQAFKDLSVVGSGAQTFLSERFNEHTDDFERRKQEWQRKLEVEKKKRLLDRKAKRKLERQQQADKDRREHEEAVKEAAAQAERDRKELERQQNREMLQVSDNSVFIIISKKNIILFF